MMPNFAQRPTRYELIARASAADTAPYLGSKYHPIIQAGSSPNVE